MCSLYFGCNPPRYHSPVSLFLSTVFSHSSEGGGGVGRPTAKSQESTWSAWQQPGGPYTEKNIHTNNSPTVGLNDLKTIKKIFQKATKVRPQDCALRASKRLILQLQPACIRKPVWHWRYLSGNKDQHSALKFSKELARSSVWNVQWEEPALHSGLEKSVMGSDKGVEGIRSD